MSMSTFGSLSLSFISGTGCGLRPEAFSAGRQLRQRIVIDDARW
jgi:hypothetical protein